MKISWVISKSDVLKIKQVIAENQDPFFRKREERNVYKQNIVINKDTIIKTLLMCLLTSQQRSGPNSLVSKFLRLEPFPVTSESLEQTSNTQLYLMETLKKNGLTRYINRISLFFTYNLNKIENENWQIIKELKVLIDIDSAFKERKIADKICSEFKGFGPKQSRNFLQSLGLTKYEIPIDSRITNWLNDFGFPVTLTSSALGDIGYYHFVSDGIQELCKQAGIYPCLLDAAIFSSYDNKEWTDENTVF